MPGKTFAHGRATALAMDRPRDDLGVIVQRADDRVLVQKRQRLLPRRRTVQQLAERLQAKRTVGKRRFTGFFQGFVRVLLAQAQQPLQHARAFDAPRREHRLGPLVRLRADPTHLAQQITRRRVPVR